MIAVKLDLKQILALALVVFLFSGCGWFISGKSPHEPAPATNAVTASSIMADMHYEKAVAAHLLAFVSREDKRPWYVEDALLILERPKGEWVLVHAVRNPRYPPELKRNPSPWSPREVMDAPYVGDRTFKHRPTQKEMDQFLKDNEWQPESDKCWQVVQSEVDEVVWQRILGYNSPWFKTSKPPASPKGKESK